jgi:hypothetical protein
VLRAAARAGVAVEINASPHRMDLDSIGARRARELGVRVAISSDAHAPRELADRQEIGVAIARRGWLEASDVLNTLASESLLLRRRDRLRGGHSVSSLPAKPSHEARRNVQPKNDHARSTSRWDASLGPETARLDRALARGELDDKLERRLLLFLRGGSDDELRRALSALGGANPEQRAFELLADGQR